MGCVIIGISGRAGAGKTTLAENLIRRFHDSNIDHITLIDFADPVRKIAAEFLPREWKLHPCDLRNEEIKRLAFPSGKTVRQLLQVIGTDVGRTFDPDIWLKKYEEEINSLPDPYIVVTADVRFLNEVTQIKKLGGIVIRLLRNPYNLSHASEHDLDFVVEATKNNYTEHTTKWSLKWRKEFRRWVNAGCPKFDFMLDNTNLVIKQTLQCIVDFLSARRIL